MWFQKSMQIKKIELVSKSIWNESVIPHNDYKDNYDDSDSDSDLQWLLDRHRDGRYSKDEDEDPCDYLRRRRQRIRWMCQWMRREARTRPFEDRDVLVRLPWRRQFPCSQMDWIHGQLVRRPFARTRHDAIHVQQWSHGGRTWWDVEQWCSHLNTSSNFCKERYSRQNTKTNKNKKHFFKWGHLSKRSGHMSKRSGHMSKRSECVTIQLLFWIGLCFINAK